MYRSEKLIIDFIKKSELFRRRNFSGSGSYFDFVFLCGRKLEPNDNRSFIKQRMDEYKKFSLFSETLYKEFDDLNLDLLTIEEILLSVSSATIVIVESFGSACELGAFSFSKQSIDKLWVINNEKYRQDGSFISEGPIKKIECKDKDHVVYQRFNDLEIEFDKRADALFRCVGRKAFSKRPIQVDDTKKQAIIKDLGFIVCLLFDYIRIFGVLLEKSAIKVLKALYPAEEYTIELPSGGSIDSKRTNIVIDKLLTILNKSSILLKKTNNDDGYYSINYETIKKINMTPSGFESFIFISKFFNYYNKKQIFKLLNVEIQEGFKLWIE